MVFALGAAAVGVPVFGNSRLTDSFDSVACMAVAVVVVNFNSGRMLRECIEALESQTHRADKVVVIDNGSTDDSIAIIESAAPNCQIVRVGKNIGFAAANNFAFKQLNDCRWIALLNPDALPAQNWLEALLSAARMNPDTGIFASKLISRQDPSSLDGVGDEYHVSGLYWRRGHGVPVATAALSTAEVFSPCAAAAMYRADLFREVGGLDESYFCYAEDVDLGFRLRLAGYRCLYVPDAVAYHVGSAITGRRSDFTVYHGHRNLIWTYFKNMPWPLFWLYLPQHILLNVVTLVWFSFRGQAKIIFKAKWDALKGLPRVLRERKKVQLNRRVSVWELRRVMAKGLFRPYLRHRM